MWPQQDFAKYTTVPTWESGSLPRCKNTNGLPEKLWIHLKKVSSFNLYYTSNYFGYLDSLFCKNPRTLKDTWTIHFSWKDDAADLRSSTSTRDLSRGISRIIKNLIPRLLVNIDWIFYQDYLIIFYWFTLGYLPGLGLPKVGSNRLFKAPLPT